MSQIPLNIVPPVPFTSDEMNLSESYSNETLNILATLLPRPPPPPPPTPPSPMQLDELEFCYDDLIIKSAQLKRINNISSEQIYDDEVSSIFSDISCTESFVSVISREGKPISESPPPIISSKHILPISKKKPPSREPLDILPLTWQWLPLPTIKYVTAGFRCRLCFNKQIQPRRWRLCGRCNLFVACSEHFTKTRDEHKGLCNGIKRIMEKKQISHIFELAKSYRTLSANAFRLSKINAVIYVSTFLKRQLTNLETSLLLYPLACQVCRDANVFLIVCTNCYSAYYCPEHYIRFLRLHTPTICTEMASYFNVMRYPNEALDFDFSFYVAPKWLLSINQNPSLTYATVNSTVFPTNLFTLVNSGLIDPVDINIPITGQINTPEKLVHIKQYTGLCNFSCAATLLWLFWHQNFFAVDYMWTPHLVVHVFGVNENVSQIKQRHLWLFWSWMPNLSELHINQIGPNLLENRTIQYRDKHTNGWVYYSTAKERYESYWNDMRKFCLPPDIVVFFNAIFFHNIHNFNIDNWAQTLEFIIYEHGRLRPIMFTSSTRLIARLNEQFVNIIVRQMGWCECHWIVKSHFNRYRDPRPFHAFNQPGDFQYENNFISIFHIIAIKDVPIEIPKRKPTALVDNWKLYMESESRKNKE